MSAPPPWLISDPGVQGPVLPVQQGMTSQPQVIIISAPPAVFEPGKTQRGCFVGLGTTQLIIGFLCIIFNIGAILAETPLTTYVAPGIWCGILFVITGSFGIAGGKAKSKAMVVTFLVLSIISACISVIVWSLSSVSLSVEGQYSYYYDSHHKTAIAMDAHLIILGLIELVIAIISAGSSCGVLCCRNQVGPVGVAQYVTTPGGHTYAAQTLPMVLPAGVAGTSHQATYPVQQWTSGQGPPPQQWSYQGPLGAVGGQSYDEQRQPTKQDLAGVHGMDAQQVSLLDAPPPYYPTTT